MTHVQGYCPMGCGETLMLGTGGYVTCGYLGCTVPDAVSTIIGVRERGGWSWALIQCRMSGAAPVEYWPVCLHHGDVPVQSIAGWSYCDGVGWHDEDGHVSGRDADLAVFELSVERLFARLNPSLALVSL